MNPAVDLGTRRWRVLASAMVSFFAVGMTYFAVPPLVGTLRASFALSNLAIGVLMGAIAIPAIVLSVPLGVAVDRWSARAAGFGGLAAMLVGAVVFAAAPGYLWLLAGRSLFGVGGLVMNLLLARAISQAFAGRELSLAMGLFTGTYPASMIVLFSLHPWLDRTLGWRGELGVLAALVAVALPLHWWAMPAGAPNANIPAVERVSRSVPSSLVALSVAWMLYFAAFAAIPTFAPEWAGGGSRGLLVTSVITWMALLATPFAGAAIDRGGRPQAWCTAGLCVLAATLTLMAAGVLPPLAAMATVGVVAGAVPPAFYSLPAQLAPADRIGFAFGFITAFSNLGALAGPALAGAVRDVTPAWSVVWGVLAGVALLGAAAAALIRPPGISTSKL